MRERRNTEILLLLAALPVLLVLYACYVIQQANSVDGVISLTTVATPLALFGAFVLAHLVVRKFAPNADPAILPITFLLSGIGIIFIMRLNPDLAPRQLIWLYVSIGAMMLTLIVVKSLNKLSRYKFTIMLVGIILLILPAIAGTEISGSKIWIVIGPFSFQPGELAKVLIVVFLASYLADNREMLSVSTWKLGPFQLPDPKTILPLIVMWVISLIIVAFERDLGSALLFFGIFLLMLYITTGRVAYVIAGIVLGLVGAFGLYQAFSHVQTRVAIWLDPFSDAQGKGYQLVQAIYSMADGGLSGQGIGRGLCDKIPVVESDFIFAAIAEEMGFLGASAILILFMLFTVRGFVTAARAKSDVAAFMATGLTAAISFQAFIIIGGVTRLIPLTGLTLPFMSQGGSSLLASFIIVGLLLRAGDEGTGVETEIVGVAATDGGILGRYALGRRISALTVVFTLLFAVLIGNLTYIQIIKADDYKAMPNNNHTLAWNERNQRGAILTNDGTVLAQSVLGEDGVTYVRQYPQGSMAAHLVGYSSSQYGQTGIENGMNDYLAGTSGFATWGDAFASLAGTPSVGNDVVLTIDADVQASAEAALAGRTGAIVVMDPATGAILALASSPTYDANDIAGALDNQDVLYNRATQALYAPGSSFKAVTLAGALSIGIVNADTVYNAPASIDIGGAPITNYDNEEFGQITVQQATEVSSNTVYGQIAVQLGSTNLVAYADGFGFDDEDLARDFALNTSLMPNPSEMTEWETAWSGCGQPVGEHASPAGPQATVVQMACVMAAIQNGGTLMQPYVVDRVQSSTGDVVFQTSPSMYGRPLSPEVAAEELAILTAAVETGSGSAAQVPGAIVAGKTGTAQTGREVDDAWFIGSATANGQAVVVAVVVEEGGKGSTTAAPIAGQVMETALHAKGAL